MAVRVPTVSQSRAGFFSSVYFLDALIALAGLGGIFLGAVKLFRDSDHILGWSAIGFGILACVCAAIKAIQNYRKEKKGKSLHELEGCLYTLYTVISGIVDDKSSAGLRLTLHTPTKDGEKLLQILDYVGDPRRKLLGAGRTFNGVSGVIGKAYQDYKNKVANPSHPDSDLGCICFGRLEDGKDFMETMRVSWAMPYEEAKEKDREAKSWLAIAIVHGRELYAILFADSTSQNIFFIENVRRIILLACTGIAYYIGKRYG